MKNLVIVPVYNESPTLRGVICQIKKYHGGDIVVIDDGSTDGSEAFLESVEGLTVIRHDGNLGYGKSLIDGFEYAMDNGYDFAVTIDCDEQHEPRCIPRMFASVGDNDILSGSRYLDDSGEGDEPPPDRRNINMIITKIINQLTGLNLTDSFCGFKCYRVSALARLALGEAGYAQPIQLWIQAWQFGLTVAETPVPRIYKTHDRKFGGGLDEPDARMAYYHRVLETELSRWSMSLSPELIQTI